MNKIYKVIYSKVRNCYVVVSELAKNQRKCHSVNVKGKTALAAAILLALTSFCLPGMPSVAQAADGTESLRNNDFVGANDQYWYYDEKKGEWTTYQYALTSAFNNRARGKLPNYQGGGAKLPGAITAGLYAQAGQQTVTIGDRNAGQSKGSVFIGERSGYNNGDNAPAGMTNNYVTSVGFQSNATGWGSIAIGSNATAENSKMESQVVKEVGDAHTSGTVSDDTYGIEENPTIQGASVALGYNAHSNDGNIAIGSYSDATSTDKGDSYVSVGNGTLKRRITNVAKGTDNSDVVTVGQMNDAIKQADNLNVNAGWGINVADENDPTNTGKGTKNVISLKHNLGTGYNDAEANGMIIGGLVEDRDSAKQYGAADANSVVVGAGNALASGNSSVVVGGLDNVASGATSVVVGGDNNNAAGNQSAVFGGRDNKAAGVASTASGGIMNAAVGQQATAIGGSNNYVLGSNATAVGGLGRDYANGETVYDSAVRGSASVGIAGGSTGEKAMGALAAGHQAVVTTENGTAIGYQATTDEAKTIAFGHDAGDVSGYTIEWNQLPKGQVNADGTANDYTKAPKSVTPTTYKDAYYNRLVKVADGQDAHDVVVMEQLKPYTKSDASNIGNNLKTYTVGDNGETITEADATADKKKANKDAWGKALGAEPFTTGTSAAATNASTSDQLVTGKTLYNYDAPVAETGKKLNYVSANNTTGQNLLNLDRQVKTNTDTLSDVNSRSVKYDTKTVNDKTVVDNTKITLAGEGGTTITNLKDGVKNNDAATVGQLNSKIAGVTYTAGNGIAMDSTAKTISAKAGNGITVDTNGINAKAGTGITVNANGINVNTGKHLSVNTNGQVDVDDNGKVAENDGNLVTGDTVYKALNGGMNKIIIGTPGKDGKDGKDGTPGTIGLVGPAGTNGKDGVVDITIQKGEDGKDGTKGANGVDGKNGINRIVYEDKNGKHQVATMEDGLKFAGDDGQNDATKAIAKKLNNTVDIIGGADSTKLTANNIGVNNVDGKLKIQLAKNLAGITSIANQTTTGKGDAQTTTGAKIDLKDDGSISVNSGKITDVKSGLTATDGTYADTDKNNAANIGDVHSMIEKEAGNTDDKLALKANVAADNIGTHITDTTAQKTNLDNWGAAIGTGAVADSTNEHANQLVTGKTVYDALHGGLDNITVGKDGKDGKDGSIGIAGQNGKDGYTMTYIKTEQGAAGVDGKDGITRVVYQDKDGNGKHTFATLDDGLKFKGDDSTVIARKLNEQLNITGGADSTKLTDKNIGVNSSTDGLKIQLAKDLTSITSISGSTDDKGAKITLDTTDKNISLNGGSIKDVASNLTKDGKIIKGSANNAASISDVQTLVQQGVDNGYTNGNGITIQKDGTSGKNVISVNQGDGLKFDSGKLAVNTGDGLTVDETTKALKIKTSDSNLKVDSKGIGLSDKITIGSDKTKQVTIDGTNGEISGLTNTTWDSKANDYSNSTKAATESQVDAAVKDAVKQAGENDIHVAAGSYAVNDQNQVSMNLVDKNNDTKGTVIITDVAKSSEMGDVSKLADGVKNAGGKTTTVVDAINNVNTSMNTKIGDQNYSKSNTSGTNKYVSDGDSITSAIGKLDGAVQQAASAAGKHSTVSEGSNIKVNGNVQNDGHTDYKVSLKDDISLNSVTTKSATTDTLTVNNSATIGGVTIANKTISGLDDTKIEKGSTNAVNAGTIWNELRPSGGTYINQNNTTAQNITNLDTQVKRNSDLVNSDGSTIKIGGKDSATKVDISDKNGSGRVITGVVTDTNDASSAANVGYVNNMAAANTQQIYRDMNNAYGRLDNNINRAAAGSNALAALHPLEFDPDDKLSFAMGYGHYHNANAAAVGAFYQPDSKTQFNFGVALGNGDPGFNAGIAFKLGKSSPYAGMNRVTLIHAVQDLKASEEAKDKRIDALEKENQEMKKQLQAILAKLNG